MPIINSAEEATYSRPDGDHADDPGDDRNARPPKTVAVLPPSADVKGHVTLVAELKQRIADARFRAALWGQSRARAPLLGIGRDILPPGERKLGRQGHRPAFALDLGRVPRMTGFSARNLKYMRRSPRLGRTRICATGCCTIARDHNPPPRCREAAIQRTWYAGQAIENGWSRNVLVHQIESGYSPAKAAPLRISSERCRPGVDFAQESPRPYSFDFLSLGPEMLERNLERGLIEHSAC